MPVILEMREIEKSFSGTRVLNNVSLTVMQGEVHALMGENGAGKSTLMKILMGIYGADAGQILVDQVEMRFKNPKEALENGIAMIHQELNPVLEMQVFENIYIGREIQKFGIANKKAMVYEAGRLLEKLNIPIKPTAYMKDLSVAQCQLIEIVKAISVGAKIIIMDEPTSAITDREIETLFSQIEQLKKQNVAIVYISHKMDEIFRICDRITVLRDGEYIGTEEAAHLDPERLIQMMVGRAITEVYPKCQVEPGPVVMEVRNMTRGNKVKNVCFSLRRGEILGIAGLVGAGRSELAEAIFGVKEYQQGEVYIQGKPVRIRHPNQAIGYKMALITEDRKSTGLNLTGTVAENITQVALERIARCGVLNRQQENKAADYYIKKLGIKTTGRNQKTGSLSGGNQQKVILGKWLFDEPEILILDEPTRGIDVGAKRDIYLLIGELVQQGKAVIVISSEIPEIMGLSDRILVMAEGRVTGELQRQEFSQEKIMALAAKFGEA